LQPVVHTGLNLQCCELQACMLPAHYRIETLQCAKNNSIYVGYRGGCVTSSATMCRGQNPVHCSICAQTMCAHLVQCVQQCSVVQTAPVGKPDCHYGTVKMTMPTCLFIVVIARVTPFIACAIASCDLSVCIFKATAWMLARINMNFLT